MSVTETITKYRERKEENGKDREGGRKKKSD